MNVWTWLRGDDIRLEQTPPPDADLPLDWRAIPSTTVPSARAVNKLLDYWRDKAIAEKGVRLRTKEIAADAVREAATTIVCLMHLVDEYGEVCELHGQRFGAEGRAALADAKEAWEKIKDALETVDA